jgi:hypothetical protein
MKISLADWPQELVYFWRREPDSETEPVTRRRLASSLRTVLWSRHPQTDGRRLRYHSTSSETRTFSTMTRGLLELPDWLTAHRVTHIAVESTGVYWKPVHNLLEDDFTLLVVNAQHITEPRIKNYTYPTCFRQACITSGLLRSRLAAIVSSTSR